MERRKTTTETKLYATLDDHYRMMFGVEPEVDEVFDERPQPNRPMSWHPSSAQMQGYRPSSYFEPQQNWSRQYSTSPRDSTHGSDFYSLSTRNSAYEPMYKHATYPGGYAVHGESDESDRSLRQAPSYAHSVVDAPVSEPLPWYLQQWAQQNQTQANMDSLDGSPDFLPIQHPATQDEEMDEGEKLVALGLYDLPEPSQAWNAFTEPTGKGLKLEETWQPPAEQDDDEEEEEELDDASSEASMDEPSPPLPSTNQQSQQLQLPVHAKVQAPNNMEGQSFFFDDEETVSKEWWFQQLRQPSNPVREHGLGYGWL
jgi:hypothetical protein